jgi:hypothetical protein
MRAAMPADGAGASSHPWPQQRPRPADRGSSDRVQLIVEDAYSSYALAPRLLARPLARGAAGGRGAADVLGVATSGLWSWRLGLRRSIVAARSPRDRPLGVTPLPLHSVNTLYSGRIHVKGAIQRIIHAFKSGGVRNPHVGSRGAPTTVWCGKNRGARLFWPSLSVPSLSAFERASKALARWGPWGGLG